MEKAKTVQLLCAEYEKKTKNNNTMYEVLAGNRVRKIPEMRTQEVMGVFEDYQEKLAKQPTYEISGSHNWKEGQLIEEGKDFEIKEIQWGSGTYVDYKRVAIPSVTNEEDELLNKRIKEFATNFFYWWYNQPGTNTDEGFASFLRTQEGEYFYKELKQLFKPSSSSLHS
jgi:hypothetical protein